VLVASIALTQGLLRLLDLALLGFTVRTRPKTSTQIQLIILAFVGTSAWKESQTQSRVNLEHTNQTLVPHLACLPPKVTFQLTAKIFRHAYPVTTAKKVLKVLPSIPAHAAR